MPRPRRTEHYWPVAHTLNDLLPLIPDPASFEVGSVLRIERIMLPDVHLQLVKAIAERFCPENGWQTVYLAMNNYRAEAMEAVTENTDLVNAHRNARGVRLAMGMARENGQRPLVVHECGIMRQVAGCNPDGASIEIPLPVKGLAPISCPRCGTLHWFEEFRKGQLVARCGPCRTSVTASMPISVSGRTKHGESKSWSKSDCQLAQKLRDRGFTYSEIGARVNRSFYAVAHHFRQGGYEGKLKRQKRRAYLDQFDI